MFIHQANQVVNTNSNTRGSNDNWNTVDCYVTRFFFFYLNLVQKSRNFVWFFFFFLISCEIVEIS
jgi:hypothetical protein